MMRFYLSQARFVVAVSLLSALAVMLVVYVHFWVRDQVLAVSGTNLGGQARLRGAIIEQEINQSVRYTQFLSATPGIQGIVRAAQNNGFDELQKTPMILWKQRLETIFSAYILHRQNISQIRYIGFADGGKELVRVERHGDQILRVSEDKLQAKAQRDYFIDTQALKTGELYVSPINLNRELGKIEEPLQPTYRVATPIFSSDNQFFGIVIVNFDAEILLSNIRASNDAAVDVFFLNRDGHYLLHPEKTTAFGFEFGRVSTWNEDIQVVKEVAQSELSVARYLPSQIKYWYVSETVNFDGLASSPSFTVIAAAKDTDLRDQMFARQALAISVVAVVLSFTILLLFFYRKFCEKAENELKVKAEFEAIVNGSDDAIISIDGKGKVHSCNDAALALIGVAHENLRSFYLPQLFKDENVASQLKISLEKVMAHEQSENFDIVIERDGEQSKHLSVAVFPINLGSSKVGGAAIICRDISHVRQLHQSLEKANQQLHDRNVEMERFIYTVSHDLKSPLVTIGGFARRVLDSVGESLDEKNHHRLDRILKNVNHMAGLLSELLNISRVIQQDLKLERCDIRSCIDEACEALNHAIAAQDIEFQIELGIGELNANRRLLIQCLQNLIQNAISYREPERPLTIQIQSNMQKDFCCVSVSDNGIGIKEKNYEQIFRIFERLDVGEGSGVGLAIVKTVMEKHRGWVKLKSEHGVGSTFSLCFPIRSNTEDS